MGNTFYFAFEKSLMEFLQGFINPFTQAITIFFTNFGQDAAIIVILGFLYWSYDKEYAKYVCTNICVGMMICPLVKNIVCRRRPYMDIESIKCIKAPEKGDIYNVAVQSYSCPSGHTINATVLFGSLSAYKSGVKILRILAIVMPFLVGLSRIILGVHYPTDVFLGWVFGGICVAGMNYLQKKFKRRWVLHLLIVLFSLPGIFYCRTNDYFLGLGVMIGLFLVMPFEERFVKFENTKSLVEGILRLVVGIILYLIINSLLKLIFKADDETIASVFRGIRYFIDIFLLFGFYPMLFKYIPKRK
ncbi:MAG: phosphatase PAP2 family protein [Butyrivibrio sp.]|nr:phosphatase PAP2 family protein [Butyrivibrio sp.]